MNSSSGHLLEIRDTLLPSVLRRGPDAVKGIVHTLGLLGKFSKVLIISDEITYDIAGKTIENLLNKAYITTKNHIISSASDHVLERVKEIIDEDGFEIVIGVGGGRPIDIAKKSSFDHGIPFVSVPTAPSHDGIGSARASIKVRAKNVSMEAQPPAVIIADTTILSKAPYRLMAAGCGDVISNITAVQDWKLGRDLKGEPYSEYAAELSLLAARLLVRHSSEIPENSDFSNRVVINALITSGIAMAVAGSSRPASGTEHKFSHILDSIVEKPALHGVQCALGTIVTSYLQQGDWTSLKEVMTTIGIPTTASEAGLRREDVITALVRAKEIRPKRHTILGDGLTRKKAEKSLKRVGIIK